MANFRGLRLAVRIVSYNILDGGIGRADPIAEVLLAQRPDVVGLVEADDAEVLDRIAWRLGFDCIAAEGNQGRTSALLTRGEILQSVNRVQVATDAEAASRSWLEVRVALDGREMTFIVVHLSAHASESRESRREGEIATVLESAQNLREAGEPHILMGDFNANSPHQLLVRKRLPEKSLKYWDENGGHIPRRVITAIEAAGYVDTLRAVAPASADVSTTFTTRQPGQRLDFIFTHGLEPEKIRGAWVEQDRLAVYASDHFPAGAEIDVEG